MKGHAKGKRKKWRKIQSFKEEAFSLFQSATDPMTWEVSWRTSSKSYRRRRFQANDLPAAIATARAAIGLTPATPRRAHKVGEAFTDAAKLARPNQNQDSRADFFYWVKRFMRWLQGHYPERTTWHALDCFTVEEYLESIPPGSHHHALNPIRQAARLMTRRHDCPNITQGIRASKKLQRPTAKVYLVDVVAFCDYLRETAPELEAGAALQGLAGLALQETIRLTWQKVNLEQGLVEISGEIKNEYRERVLPVCARVVEALRRHAALQGAAKVQSVQPHVFFTNRGEAFRHDQYSRRIRLALRAWNPALLWTPKDLRNSLPTFSTMEGIHNDLWEMYLGHAPRTITMRHYVPRLNYASAGESGALDRQMGHFRLHVTQPIERAVEACYRTAEREEKAVVLAQI